MISIYQKKVTLNFTLLTAFICVSILLLPYIVRAENQVGLSLSVTPTLFQMSAIPQQSWSSGVKVINNNKHPITVYAQVVNFAPQGEAGEGKFLPVFEKATEGTTLAEWITLSKDPITIAPEQSYTIPFSVHVPGNAAPGGHFAAILIGTKPPDVAGAVKVATSQIVTSLFFVRIAGDVVENGVVREFRTTHSFVDTPHADFEVRFENKGNVHIQPQGEIVITNMWGKERGIIPINQQTHFGNVLPKSIRKFDFSWTGEESFSDIGRYKAILTLAYGEDERKFETSITYFYVVPVKATLIVLGILLAFILLVRWSIKVYVRRMLFLAGFDDMIAPLSSKRRVFIQEGDVRIVKGAALKAPVEQGLTDFKLKFAGAAKFLGKFKAVLNFVFEYKKFFASFIGLVLFLVCLTIFLYQVHVSQRDYEIVIDNKDTKTKLSSEEILYQKSQETHKNDTLLVSPKISDQKFDLVLVNSSETPGKAAELERVLEKKSYVISDLRSEFGDSKKHSVIIYDVSLQHEAVTLSKELGNMLLSASPASTSTATSTRPVITVYIGNDFSAL